MWVGTQSSPKNSPYRSGLPISTVVRALIFPLRYRTHKQFQWSFLERFYHFTGGIPANTTKQNTSIWWGRVVTIHRHAHIYIQSHESRPVSTFDYVALPTELLPHIWVHYPARLYGPFSGILFVRWHCTQIWDTVTGRFSTTRLSGRLEEAVYTCYPAVSSGTSNSMTALIPSHFGLPISPYKNTINTDCAAGTTQCSPLPEDRRDTLLLSQDLPVNSVFIWYRRMDSNHQPLT